MYLKLKKADKQANYQIIIIFIISHEFQDKMPINVLVFIQFKNKLQ